MYDLTNEIVVSSHMSTLMYVYGGNKFVNITGWAHRSLLTLKAEQKLLASAVFSPWVRVVYN